VAFAEGTEVLELIEPMAAGAQRGAPDSAPVALVRSLACRRAVFGLRAPGAPPAAGLPVVAITRG